MKNLLNPKWLFIINMLPIVVLFMLCYSQFEIIKTLLDENNIRLWKLFSFGLGASGLMNFAYAVFLNYKKQLVSVWYGAIALLVYIPFIYLYAYHLDEIVPTNIPQWMMSDSIFLYVGTFLMPTLVYSLFVLVSHFTSEDKEHKAWVNFLIAIAVPIIGYLFSQIILPLWHSLGSEFSVHAFLILIIVATLVFLFFLVRGIFILAAKKSAVWQKYQFVWKIPVAIVFPILGLLVNSGLAFDRFSASGGGIFGDFSNYWFYILALVNGILVCLPNIDSKLYRLLLFIGRSITFAYTLYFFLVFLPFLPLSVVAIIAIGTGFLMLTPLLLFVIHVNELSKDFAYLKTLFSKKLILAISVLGFLVIPACITATYLKDKRVLNETLAYLYSPDYSKKYSLDKHSLQKTLYVIKNHKNHDNSLFGFFGSGQPFLSSYFNWLVLDNLTLSDAKISSIEKVFFGETPMKLWSENIQSENVKISTVSTNSVYDKSQKAWRSWVDLEITNKSENTWFSEYATTIDLPEGCWISDYYLYIGDKKEQGILAEKKTAMWVFSNIRNENRDPGILYYLTGNKVAFRVFPFAKDEVRKTGIEFLHKEPVKLTIDNNSIELGNTQETICENIETENFVYVSSQQKQTLPTVYRKPYFHFLVDVSEGKKEYAADFTKRIEQFLADNTEFSENAQISFVNSYVTSFPLDKDWKQRYQSQPFEGGFFLDRAIKMALLNPHKDKSYPVIVVVADSIQQAILEKDFSDFKFAFPESSFFFNLDSAGRLCAHSLIDKPAQEISPVIIVPTYEEFMKKSMSAILHHTFDQPVLEYKLSGSTSVYLCDNNEPSILLKKAVFEIQESEIKEKDWESALSMQAKWMSQTLHPETSDKEWLNLVKYSFVSKVMTPVTSYLVVENEAQKAILKKKQEQVLSGNKSLDLDEDTQRMSEPSLWILVILLGLVWWYREKRRTQ